MNCRFRLRLSIVVSAWMWLAGLALTLAVCPVPAGVVAGEGRGSPTIKFRQMPGVMAQPFALEDVRLLEGPFRHAMELDQAYLRSLDPDRLLQSFRLNAGIPSSAKPYGGWMTPGHTGCAEFVGHYLSACALMYASTGDERLRENANRVVTGLGQCQAKLGTGYLHTKPDHFTDRAEAPLGLWYQIHKLMAGLMEVYVHCQNPEALAVARRLGDWAKSGTDRLTDEQMQRMLSVEPGGINEALANLAALTGEEKYLRLALRFNHLEVIGPATRREDNLTGKHANTQIPKFIGVAREYELNGEHPLEIAASFFWDTVVHERSYVIGGNSLGEFFSPKEKLSTAIGPNTCETCNTYNMLKLTRHLFGWEPRAEYADYYERALYNHILASQNPSNGMMCYFLPLAYAAKEYCTPEETFWCCTGTGVENHAKYGDSIYFHRAESNLWVNLFIPSVLRWSDAGVTLRQETKFPDEERARLLFTCDRPVEFRLNLRHPCWATSGFEIRVNGQPQPDASTPGTYVVVTRTWQSGDTLEVTMPFTLRAEGFRDNPRRFAFMNGPLVLCADTQGLKGDEAPYPAFIGDAGHLPAGLRPALGRAGVFEGPSQALCLGEASSRRVTLEPLWRVHGDRKYVVYWNAFSPAEWQAEEARRKALANRTVDRVLPGIEPSEREHEVRGERAAAGENRWRHAVDGGWFSWSLKVLPDQPQELHVKYWGGDNGGREFDLLVDGAELAAQRLDNNRPGEFYEEIYPLAHRFTQGKQRITLKFQAHPGKMAGGVFGCSVVVRDGSK